MMKPSKALGVAAIVSIAVVFLFLTSGAAPAMSSSQVNSFTSQANLLPNPTMNSNVTWSTYYHGWNPLEYNNGTGNQTLNAGLSQIYENPITVNPLDLQSKYLENSNTTGVKFNSSKLINVGGSSGGSVQTESYANGIYTMTGNTTASKSTTDFWILPHAISDTFLPSNNLQYDYITASFSLSGTAMTGVEAYLNIENGTGSLGQAAHTTIYPGETIWESANLLNFKGANFNVSKSTQFRSQININLPQHASTTYTIKLNAFMITTEPLYLGNNKTTTQYVSINQKYTTFNPDFPWQDINNNGYTVAVSQPLGNITTQQSEISGNPSYVEQVTYEGNYCLPSAPDLTYSRSAISEKFSVPTSQTTVLDINGLSLLNTISGKNGTITLMTVNPNQKTTLIQIVEYTSSQWTAVSGPPGFFSVNGILYYFDEIVLGIIAVVGLAGGAAVARTRSLRRVK